MTRTIGADFCAASFLFAALGIKRYGLAKIWCIPCMMRKGNCGHTEVMDGVIAQGQTNTDDAMLYSLSTLI